MRVVLVSLTVSLFLFGCGEDEPVSTSAADAVASAPSVATTSNDANAALSASKESDGAVTTPADSVAAGAASPDDAGGTMSSSTTGAATARSSASVNDDAARASRTDRASDTAAASRVREEQYTIERGDTLVEIAKAHDLDAQQLAEWNGIDDPRRLQIGQKIRLSPPGG